MKRWARDADWRQALADSFASDLNIEGLVGGYGGPGGMTIMPHKVAKLDMRLVPNMTPEGSWRNSRAHLDKRGSATSR